MSDGFRKLVIGAAGILIILVALGALLLPLAEHIPAARVIGWMLLTAGLLEGTAAAARWAHRPSAFVAAGATLIAGMRLLFDQSANFFEVLNLVILWLVIRTAALGFAAYAAQDRLTTWLVLSAAVDFLLAIALLAGLPIAILVVGLFGPTARITATFAWVLAISFIATGMLLVATAILERRAETAATVPEAA